MAKLIHFSMKVDGHIVADGSINRWEAFKAGFVLMYRALLG